MLVLPSKETVPSRGCVRASADNVSVFGNPTRERGVFCSLLSLAHASGYFSLGVLVSANNQGEQVRLKY